MNPLDLPVAASEGLIAGMAGLAAGLLVLGLWLAVAAYANRMARVTRATRRSGSAPRRAERLGLAHRVWRGLSGLSALRGKLDANLRERLDQAGFRTTEAAHAFMAAKALLPFVFGGFAGLVLYVAGPAKMVFTTQLLIVLSAAVAGLYAPTVYVSNQIAKRRAALQRGVPDALDLMVICAEAGTSLDAAVQRVARELGGTYPELGAEMAQTAIELGFLPERRIALQNLARRTGLESIRSVVATLQQAEKYGTPLGQSLRVLAGEYRNERMMKAEEKAARLPAVLTVPLICFIMPALFVVLIGPAIIRTMDSFSQN